jgi:hypothetical protein
MVTKLSRATGEVEYGLPVWLFFEIPISSVVSIFVGAADIKFRGLQSAPVLSMPGAGCADL